MVGDDDDDYDDDHDEEDDEEDDDDVDEETLLEGVIGGFVNRAAMNPDLCVFCEEPHEGGDINGLPACPKCLRETEGPVPAAGAARVRELVARAVVRNAAEIEGCLVKFRSMYLNMTREKRDEFRALLEKALRIDRADPDRVAMLMVKPAKASEDTEVLPSVVSARTLAAAIDAWERGEEFLAGPTDW